MPLFGFPGFGFPGFGFPGYFGFGFPRFPLGALAIPLVFTEGFLLGGLFL